METKITWKHPFNEFPKAEFSRMGKTKSEIVFACDENMDMYIARHYTANGNDYWLEESLSGVNTAIQSVVLWAEIPTIKIKQK
jgi:hypothetical protein